MSNMRGSTRSAIRDIAIRSRQSYAVRRVEKVQGAVRTSSHTRRGRIELESSETFTRCGRKEMTQRAVGREERSATAEEKLESNEKEE